MKLPQSFTTVTPLSKALAILVFVSLPFIGFYFGYLFGSSNNFLVTVAPTEEQKPATATITSVNKSIKTDPFIFGNYQISLPEGYGWGEMQHDNSLPGSQTGAGLPECELRVNGFPYCRYLPIVNTVTREETGLFLSNKKEKYLNSGISAITDTVETMGSGKYQTKYTIFWQTTNNPDNLNEIALDNNGKPERLVSVEGCPRPELCFICNTYECENNLDNVRKLINDIQIAETF